MSLKTTIENHAAIIFGGALITGFLAGIGALRAYYDVSSQTVITKDRERTLLSAERRFEEGEKELRELKLQIGQRCPPPSSPDASKSASPSKAVQGQVDGGVLDPEPIKEVVIAEGNGLAQFKDGNTIAARQSWSGGLAELVVNGKLLEGHMPPGQSFPVKSALGSECSIVYGGFTQPKDRPSGRYLLYSLICRAK